jgi:hypothetical protein
VLHRMIRHTHTIARTLTSAEEAEILMATSREFGSIIPAKSSKPNSLKYSGSPSTDGPRPEEPSFGKDAHGGGRLGDDRRVVTHGRTGNPGAQPYRRNTGGHRRKYRPRESCVPGERQIIGPIQPRVKVLLISTKSNPACSANTACRTNFSGG